MLERVSGVETAGEAADESLPVCAWRSEDHLAGDGAGRVLQGEVGDGEVVGGRHCLEGMVEGVACVLAVLRGLCCPHR